MINLDLSEKQTQAFNILQDKETTELFYGGAAGGGKSFLGCAWLVINCLNYPGSRWLMGRAILKSLKESTLLTFLGICRDWGLEKGKQYNMNHVDGIVKFFNGSEIYLKDLFLYPSDPEFDSLGSTEYTGAFLDECSQITNKAKNIVMSRIRYKLEEFKLIPKLFLASNPSKNFLYYDFYKPWKENTLPTYRKFVPALVQDNPFISPHYIENLKKLDKVSKERLLYGNFEYDDDPSRLFEYDDLLEMFNITVNNNSTMYLSVDVARFGNDKCVFVIWKGLQIVRIIHYAKTSTKFVVEKIEELCRQYRIAIPHVVIDEDGVGGGVVDNLNGAKGFVNNSRQREIVYGHEEKKLNFANLKTQCYFKLADCVHLRQIGIYQGIEIELKEKIIEELEQMKRKDPDKDNKLMLVPKDIIKEKIGRSPDFADAIMMRMLFEVDKKEFTFFMG